MRGVDSTPVGTWAYVVFISMTAVLHLPAGYAHRMLERFIARSEIISTIDDHTVTHPPPGQAAINAALQRCAVYLGKALTRLLLEAEHQEIRTGMVAAPPANAGMGEDFEAHHAAQTQVIRNQVLGSLEAIGYHIAMAETRMVEVQAYEESVAAAPDAPSEHTEALETPQPPKQEAQIDDEHQAHVLQIQEEPQHPDQTLQPQQRPQFRYRGNLRGSSFPTPRLECPRHHVAGAAAEPHSTGASQFTCGCCVGTCVLCGGKVGRTGGGNSIAAGILPHNTNVPIAAAIAQVQLGATSQTSSPESTLEVVGGDQAASSSHSPMTHSPPAVATHTPPGIAPAAATLVNSAYTALHGGMGEVVTAICEPNVVALSHAPQVRHRRGGMQWWRDPSEALRVARVQGSPRVCPCSDSVSVA